MIRWNENHTRNESAENSFSAVKARYAKMAEFEGNNETVRREITEKCQRHGSIIVNTWVGVR
jgi:hypothetical protein